MKIKTLSFVLPLLIIFFCGCATSNQHQTQMLPESQVLPVKTMDKVYSHYKLYPAFSKYFTKENCSLVMDKYYYINCYSYDYKGTKAVAYKIESKILNMGTAGKRPAFKSDPQIPQAYRTKTQDYTRSGYDRGHTLSNQSMNATLQAQASTFLMSNITPQNPQINQRVWRKAEDRERFLAKQKGSAEVLNIVFYAKDKSKIQYIKNGIAIPELYVKVIEAGDVKECYEYPNHKVEDERLESYRADCERFVK
ncbi:DNA/RNA non-specific endonuclease [Helicobacter sp. 12S02232-10]|uniref:DNA/RNA non-specific endonuclease n=1 Tax=Helicobacter sp. 12S02232-10 TaxID=1476197 RepID=UPI0026C58FFD